MMRFTIFTPTYNRAHLIINLYHSLLRQTYKDFEWIVVNDGSTDETDQLFAKIRNDKQCFFPVKYVTVPNGGKHRAINKGLQMASGELFFIVDSDDYLTDDSLEIADHVEKEIPNAEKNSFCGICGLRGYSEEQMVGTSFINQSYVDVTSLEREKYHITGDKAEIFYTNLLKQYPFPEFDNEKFVTEVVVWDKLAAAGFKLRYFNKIIYICNYQNDGLTATYQQIMINSPKGYGLYLQQEIQYGRFHGLNKWQKYLEYYYDERNRLSFHQIARNLGQNTCKLYLRLFFMRLFYKLYDN